VLDVFFELIQLLPNKVQWLIAGIIAALLVTFLVFLVYLYFTGNLW
jgi:hypothetical protein